MNIKIKFTWRWSILISKETFHFLKTLTQRHAVYENGITYFSLVFNRKILTVNVVLTQIISTVHQIMTNVTRRQLVFPVKVLCQHDTTLDTQGTCCMTHIQASLVTAMYEVYSKHMCCWQCRWKALLSQVYLYTSVRVVVV